MDFLAHLLEVVLGPEVVGHHPDVLDLDGPVEADAVHGLRTRALVDVDNDARRAHELTHPTNDLDASTEFHVPTRLGLGSDQR